MEKILTLDARLEWSVDGPDFLWTSVYNIWSGENSNLDREVMIGCKYNNSLAPPLCLQ